MADISIVFKDGYYVRGKGSRLQQNGNYMSGLDPVFNPEGKYVTGGTTALTCNRVE